MKCPICRDTQIIRMPVYHEPKFQRDETELLPPQDSIREYTCPECSSGGPVSQYHVVQKKSQLQGTWDDIGIEHVVRSLARQLISEAASRGLVTVEKTDNEIMVTVGFVDPRHVAFMEDRLKERAREAAEEASARAADIIRTWGTAIGDRFIPKELAIDMVRRAVKEILER